MNHQQARRYLFNTTFLLGGWRRGQALKFLFAQHDAEAARILIDAVDREHPSASEIQSFFEATAERAVVEVLIASWAEQHRAWLGPIAIERALALELGETLPLDRETAWFVGPFLRKAVGTLTRAAEA